MLAPAAAPPPSVVSNPKSLAAAPVSVARLLSVMVPPRVVMLRSASKEIPPMALSATAAVALLPEVSRLALTVMALVVRLMPPLPPAPCVVIRPVISVVPLPACWRTRAEVLALRRLTLFALVICTSPGAEVPPTMPEKVMLPPVPAFIAMLRSKAAPVPLSVDWIRMFAPAATAPAPVVSQPGVLPEAPASTAGPLIVMIPPRVIRLPLEPKLIAPVPPSMFSVMAPPVCALPVVSRAAFSVIEPAPPKPPAAPLSSAVKVIAPPRVVTWLLIVMLRPA